MAPLAFSAAMFLFVHRGILYRQVFTAAAQSLSYAGASAFFRLLPNSFAGGAVGVGLHAFTWCAAVAACEIIGNRGHHFLIMGAVKLTSPQVRIMKVELDREGAQALFVEMDLGILITLAVAISPVLIIIAVPTVLLVRRFLVFPILSAQSRVDSKTGLLNVSTWEAEAESEISRSIRTRNPVSLALVDIDHFKLVNDTHGHLVGDKVLKAVAEALTTQSRDYDRAGRFGGEEFVLLLASTTATDALKIAERLRSHVEGLEVPVDERPGGPVVQVTISIGVTSIERGETRELIDLVASADAALYQAKQGGRNRVAAMPAQHDIALGTSNAGLATEAHSGTGAQPAGVVPVHVQANPTALSLCSPQSLSVPARTPHESGSRL